MWTLTCVNYFHPQILPWDLSIICNEGMLIILRAFLLSKPIRWGGINPSWSSRASKEANKKLEQVRGSISTKQTYHRNCELDVRPIDVAYSSTHKDYDDKHRGVRSRMHLRDDLEASDWGTRIWWKSQHKKIILNRFKPLKGYLDIRSTIKRNLISWLFSRWKGMHSCDMRI